MVNLTLDEEVTTNELPSSSQKHIPKGPKLTLEPSVPKDHPYYVPEKTGEDVRNMSLKEKMEYSEDLKRQREYLGGSSFLKGIASGATFGGSERIPSLKPEEYEPGGQKLIGELLGSAGPIGALYKFASAPLRWLAGKSPILTKQLDALARLTGAGIAGAEHEAISQVAQGKQISPEDMLGHGAEWAILDATLGALGMSGKFASSVIRRSRASKVPASRIVNNVVENLKDKNIDLSSPQKTAKEAFRILEKEPEIATKELKAAEKLPAGKIEQIGRETIESPAKTEQYATTSGQEIAKPSLAGRKISSHDIKNNLQRTLESAEPYAPSRIVVDSELENILSESAEKELDTIAEKPISKQDLGNTIREDIERQRDVDKKSYAPLYVEVETVAETIEHSPKETINTAQSVVKNLNSLKTKPTGYQTVITTLNDALHDLGYQVVPVNNKLVIKDSLGNAIKLNPIEFTEHIKLSKSMELARRLNQIVDYDILDPGVKRVLKPVVASLKRDIKSTLSDKAPSHADLFQQAETAYAQTAEKYGRDTIRKIRGQESGEKIASSITSPTVLQDLQPVVSPKTKSAIERELLQDMRNLNFQKAMQFYREAEPHLSPKAKKLGQKILNEKKISPQAALRSKTHDAILTDLSLAFESGQRPKKALDLWKTTKGQRLIEDALKGTKNKNEILGYLREQSFYDFAKSVIEKDGKINFKKLSEYAKDPATRENLRQIGGENAVSLFDNLAHYKESLDVRKMLFDQIPISKDVEIGKHILKRFKDKKSTLPKAQQSALDVLEKKVDKASEYGKERLKKMARTESPVKFAIDDFMNSLGIPGKTTLALLGSLQLGIPHTVVTYGTAKIMYKLAFNRKVQQAFKEAANASRSDPSKFFILLEHLGNKLIEES